ncbi:MAG: alpha/beta hydrolase [Myxococcales bacterium]|nr:alpha/beta hydrolase [Myxococcales bacterium]MCB9714133.1 alpha/beta hydrolase [Myxococcales bacterium]
MATFVLVHGAFEGGWCWQRVARRLRAKGHEVHTPTLTGCGERAHLLSRDIGLETHVEDVCARLELEDLHDVILVGHSYGGAVVTVVGDRMADRIRRLVYLDAAAPGPGQASTGAFAEGTEDKLAEMAEGTDWTLPPLPLSTVGITDPDDVAWVEPRRFPHPLRTLEEPLHLERGDAPPPFPVSYVVHTDKQGMIELFGVDPLAPFVGKARQLGWRLTEIDAGHDAMITHPDRVAEVLEAEAKA